jgi:hypothetical protein
MILAYEELVERRACAAIVTVSLNAKLKVAEGLGGLNDACEYLGFELAVIHTQRLEG